MWKRHSEEQKPAVDTWRPIRASRWLAAWVACCVMVSMVAAEWRMDVAVGGPAPAQADTLCGSGSVTCQAVYEEEGTVFRSAEPCGWTALTCNVDWGEEQIPGILDILDERGVKITFFVSGVWAKNNPDLLRRMYVEGHQIGSHGYRHKLCSKVSVTEAAEEITKTAQVIEPLIGEELTLFAPPSGDYNAETVELCRQLKYRLILWSADTIDWKAGSTADVITRRVLKKDLDGAIVLMHPKPETVKALPAILDGLEERGLKAGRVYDLGIY